MRAFVLGVAITLAAAAPAKACDPAEIHVGEGVDYVVPEDSPVRFVALEDAGNTASFSGRFVLEGDYEYGYVTDNPAADATYGQLILQFVPDPALQHRLPHWKQRGTVDSVGFENEQALVEAIIDPATLATLRRGETRSVRGHASVVVEGLRLSIDCDQASYYATFVSMKQAHRPVASRDLADYSGC
jgi:hypothetical protein